MRREVSQSNIDLNRHVILGLNAMHALTPKALEDFFECNRKVVSNHIKILTEFQLSVQDQTGSEIYYHINLK